MARIGCFGGFLAGKKKKSRGLMAPVEAKRTNSHADLRVKPEELYHSPTDKGVKAVPLEDSIVLKPIENSFSFNVKTAGNEKDESLVRNEVDADYEGGDEHDDNFSLKRDFSDFDLQALAAEKSEFNSGNLDREFNDEGELENKLDSCKGVTPEIIQSGHVSDPGMGKTTAFWGSPTLKRSCSNIETKRASRLLKVPTKSNSYDDLQNYPEQAGAEATQAITGSPLSVMTSCSADRVMLKKRSSSQVLPSRSRKLWWKLFLWSHRNLHKPWVSKPQKISTINNANQRDGYCSDTLEPSHGADLKKKKVMEESDVMRTTNIWPQNQWVAFSAESSSLSRVNAWVHSLEDSPFCPIDEEEDAPLESPEEAFCSTEVGESSSKNHNHNGRRVPEEVLQANTIIQSLNSVSSVAHIAGMGLKVIPLIAPFTSLRSVNLSGNFIVHISPGSLPKSLHTLDLSRNKITTIEGLRDLTRLRVLNLSYNRISRIGHGLSNCVLIKELYLAGNKISDVEGLHRLLKLTVLDLSFNKISTAKALGQLVANYNSLLAINLLGNPVQSNIGDEQLRKAVCSLLPNLTYLNKQPIKPQRVREVATDSVAKAALGSGGWSSRRRSTRRVTQTSSASVKGGSHRGLTSRHKSKSKHQYSTSSRK